MIGGVVCILRSGARDGSSDTDNAANHQCENGVIGSGPAGEEENRTSGHQGGDAHAADRIGRVSEEPADASRDGDKKKSENDDEHGSKKILIPASGGAFNRMKR